MRGRSFCRRWLLYPPQCSFDHWALMNGDPFAHGSRVHDIILETRKRKGLEAELPPLDRYLDTL
jgi:elongation factor 2